MDVTNSAVELPPGVERDPHCRADVGLDNCELLQLELYRDGESTTCVTIERQRPAGGWLVTPSVPGQSFRQLRPGDVVACQKCVGLGPVATIQSVTVYR